jgi:hypothetical protein
MARSVLSTFSAVGVGAVEAVVRAPSATQSICAKGSAKNSAGRPPGGFRLVLSSWISAGRVFGVMFS